MRSSRPRSRSSGASANFSGAHAIISPDAMAHRPLARHGCAARHCLIRAATAEDRPDRPGQYVDIEPHRPVADVVTVVGFLLPHVAIAANRDLPEAGNAWTHALAQLLEFRRKLLDVIVGKRTRA